MHSEISATKLSRGGTSLWIAVALTLPRHDVLSPCCELQHPYSVLQQPQKEASRTITPLPCTRSKPCAVLHCQQFAFALHTSQKPLSHMQGRRKQDPPDLLSSLTPLILPAWSKVSTAFVYCIYTQGSEKAGTSSRSPVTRTKPTTALQSSPGQSSSPHRDFAGVSNVRPHFTCCPAEARHALFLATQKVGSNF